MNLVFAAAALVLGPAAFYASSMAVSAAGLGPIATGAAASLSAGVCLLLWAIFRRSRGVSGRECGALAVLLVPPLIQILLGAPQLRFPVWLQDVSAGQGMLLNLAPPLWLGLLAAAQVVEMEASRMSVAAAIVAIGGASLLLTADDLVPRADQMLMLGLRIAVGVGTVWTWGYASRRLRCAALVSASACFLLMRGVVTLAVAELLERPEWRQVDWRGDAGLVGLQAVVAGVGIPLFLWLLLRAGLSTLAMLGIGVWVATLLQGFAVFGWSNGRADAAVAIGLAALVLGLRSSATDDRLIGLELR